jgi:PadR family transcriptional regulator PadR
VPTAKTTDQAKPMTPTAEASQNVLPRGYLQACLQLLLREAPRHGYELAAQLEALGIRSRDKGLVYRALREMESEGLVLSCWQPPTGGPVRRTYELTAEGLPRLEALTSALRETQRVLSTFVSRFEALDLRPRDAAA